MDVSPCFCVLLFHFISCHIVSCHVMCIHLHLISFSHHHHLLLVILPMIPSNLVHVLLILVVVVTATPTTVMAHPLLHPAIPPFPSVLFISPFHTPHLSSKVVRVLHPLLILILTPPPLSHVTLTLPYLSLFLVVYHVCVLLIWLLLVVTV